MTSKDEQREALKAELELAQGRPDRVTELLDQIAALDKPERAVQPKRTEKRAKKG